MTNPFPFIPDKVLAHALSITVGRYLNCAAIQQRLGIEEWLCLVNIFVDTEIRKIVRRYGEELPSLIIEVEGDPDVLANQLIQKWKTCRALQEKFPAFVDYAIAVEDMLEGTRRMETALMP